MIRLVVAFVLAIVLVTGWWLVRGVPKPVTSAMDAAMWEPCGPRYAAARTAGDSALVDGYILKPRARFSRAITCGSERERRARQGGPPDTGAAPIAAPISRR